jgi:asparagine synthase (glutamine-hydrolysing)
VIAAAYCRQGEGFADGLNGTFGGVLADPTKRHSVLFNDRFGLERIYFFQAADALFFASEAKAILRVCPETREFDVEGVTQYLALGCPIEGRTLFKGLRTVPNGSVWVVDERGRVKLKRAFRSKGWEELSQLSAGEFAERLRTTLRAVVPRFFAGGSEVGVALTGGLDTRMVMACRPAFSEAPVSYTFAGMEGKTLDAHLAGQVARACGIEHHTVRVESDFFTDFETHANRTVYVTDGCFGITGAHEIYLNRAARRLAPIRLTGAFGGEVLRGISTFKPLRLAENLVAPELRAGIADCSRGFESNRGHPVSFAVCKEIPWSIFGSIAACRSQVTLRTPYLDNDVVDLAFRKPGSLGSLPEPAIQLVAREDSKLASIPTDMGTLGVDGTLTRWLRKMAAKLSFKMEYWCNDGLPSFLTPFDSIVRRIVAPAGLGRPHKYLFYGHWLRSELSDYLGDMISSCSGASSGFWSRNAIRTMAEDHIKRRANRLHEINAVLSLDAIYRNLIREVASPGPRFAQREGAPLCP